MAQFDVHRNIGAQRAVIPFVVIVQSRRFDLAGRRVVIPMVLESAAPAAEPRLNPVFEIENTRVVLNPLHMVSIATQRLGERVASLKADGDRVIAAIDLLISRAWD
ncbi:MAG TPA: CcdB family protein [Kofleriaceae bacterium]|jgi:toxin CcdB|nr:CcdB family protein [Kofleriaceae bacterium]